MILTGDVPIKVITLGDASVGKTSILNQWIHGIFSEDTLPTITAGLSAIQLMIDGTVRAFQVWDTAGTPQYRSVLPMYCRGVDIAVMVFDLTQKSTFAHLTRWHSFVCERASPVFIIVGNKLDLPAARTVDAADASELAQRLGCRYVEVSARTDEGIRKFGRLILECGRECLSKKPLVYQPWNPRPADAPSPANEDSCC